MKIAVNCAFYEPKGGGIKEYIDNLVWQLAGLGAGVEYVIYVLQDQYEYAKANLPEEIRIKKIPFVSGNKFNRIKRSLLEKKFWLDEEQIEKFDLFHSPFFHSPKLKNTKTILTVHDLRLYRFPRTYEFFRYQFLKRKVKKSIKRADHIISISEFTKKEIIDLCGVNPDKITVIHEAINHDRFSDKNIKDPADLPEVLKKKPFLLTVGHVEPRKNYNRLIDAFLKIKENPEFNALQLVVVGKKNHSYKKIIKKIESSPDIHYLNFVSGNDLLWLYKNTALFVFPSYYEGFGFPPLEAGALDTVSAVSNVSSIPEVCADGVFYFNPFNRDEMSQIIVKALTDQQAINEVRGIMKYVLDKFSWKKNAEQTLRLYNKIK